MKDDDDIEGMVPLIRLAESYADVADIKSMGDRGNREEWLQGRRKGIGGSDVGAIMGVDPYRSPLDVYYEKVDGRQGTDNPHMKRGRALESLVADEYMERHPEDRLVPGTTFVHETHAWMMGNPDYTIVSPRHKGRGVLEIKTPARPNYERIKLKGLPLHYALQMQHYLMVTGYEWGTFAIFNADAWELTLIPAERWAPDTLEYVIENCKEFWEQHVVPQVPPSELPRERVELPKVEGRIRSMTEQPDFDRAVDAYMSASDYVKEAEALKKSAQEAVLEAIHKEVGVFESEQYRVYNTVVAGRKTLDKKALIHAKPLDRVALAAQLVKDERYSVDEIADLLSSTTLNVGDFEKQGNDFTTMRVYPVKPEA